MRTKGNIKNFLLLMFVLAFVALVASGVCCKGRATGADKGGAKAAGAAADIPEKDIFTCTSAGQWYPDNPAALRSMIGRYADQSEAFALRLFPHYRGHLRRGKPHAVGLVHGFQHVGRKLPQIVVHAGDRAAALPAIR